MSLVDEGGGYERYFEARLKPGSSASLVAGLALVDKSVHAFVRIPSRKQQIEEIALKLDAVVDAAFECAADGLLGQAHRNRSLLRNLPGHVDGLLDDKLSRNNA